MLFLNKFPRHCLWRPCDLHAEHPTCSEVPFTLRRRDLKKNLDVSLWKRIKCFSFIIRRRNLKTNNDRRFWICVWGQLSQGDRTIIVTTQFSKSFVFKILSVHTNTKIRRFEIPLVWKPFSKSLLKCSFNFQDSVVSSRFFSLCLIHIRDSIFCHKYSIFLELKYSALLIYEWKVIVDILCCSITSKKCCTEN